MHHDVIFCWRKNSVKLFFSRSSKSNDTKYCLFFNVPPTVRTADLPLPATRQSNKNISHSYQRDKLCNIENTICVWPHNWTQIEYLYTHTLANERKGKKANESKNLNTDYKSAQWFLSMYMWMWIVYDVFQGWVCMWVFIILFYNDFLHYWNVQ